jgi:nitrate reductase alpha subunit
LASAGERKANGPNSRPGRAKLKLSLLDSRDDVVTVGFPYFGGNENPHFRSIKQDPVTLHQLPVKQLPGQR